MNAILTIAANELRRLLVTPMAWIALASVQFVLAIFFFLLLTQFLENPQIAQQGVTQIVATGTLQLAGIILLLVVPFLTMRLFSEEYRSGSLTLLLSSPLSLTEIVLGKFLGIYVFLLIMLGMIALMPLSLAVGTTLDFGHLAAAILGLGLLMGAFAAIGLFISALTSQPAAAAIATFAVLFVLWIINLAAGGAGEQVGAMLSYLSLLKHFEAQLAGVFNSADVIYYLLVMLTFVVLTIWRLDAERLHG
ncbi:MAG: ABC transporter permease subunit [Gammaproteobacteria bacterium]